MHANIAVVSRTVAYVLWPKGAQKPRAKAVERWVLYGFAVFGLMNFCRLLELLPVDEPVDNFMAWQIAQRWHVTQVGGGKVP